MTTRLLYVRGVWFTVGRQRIDDARGTASVIELRPATAPMLAITAQQWHERYHAEILDRIEQESACR